MKKIFTILILLSFDYSIYAQSEDEKAIKTLINNLFDGMQKHDSTMIRACFHPSARIQVISKNRKNESVEVSTQNTIDNFVKNIGSLPASSKIEERALNSEIRIDGQLATAWTKYEFYRNEKISHCGFDAFQFYKTVEGWKISTLIYNVNKCE